MKRRRSRRANLDRYKDLVRQRVQHLYRLALQEAKQGRIERAQTLGREIWKFHVETRVRLPRWIKRGLCKRCKTPLIPGVTARVRIRGQGCLAYKTVTCLHCGWIHRYPYRRRCSHGESQGQDQKEAPHESRRNHREERSKPRSSRGDQEKIGQRGDSKGQNAQDKSRG